jgi:O-antigen/teichoic acid export membrane protein
MMAPALRMTSLVLAAGSAVLLLAGGWVIRLLFGEAFVPAYGPMRLLLPGAWALGLWRMIMVDLSVRGFPLYKTYTAAVAVGMTVALDLLLIPLWGVPGAAVASSLAYGAALGLGLRLYSRVTTFSPRELLLPRRTDFALARTKLRTGLAPWYSSLARRAQLQ